MANYPDTAAVRHGRQADALAPLGDAALPPAAAVPLLKYHALLAVGREAGGIPGTAASGLPDINAAGPSVVLFSGWHRATDAPGAAPAAMLQLLSAGRPAR